VLVEVDMAQPGYLVLADTHYPGWSATANGEAVEILSANHAFRAVVLAEGENTVVFEYAPVSFRAGVWITVGAALLVSLALVASWYHGRAS
jgi:uncharacterized membrane protein YfhO